MPGDDPFYKQNIQSLVAVIPSVTYFFPVEGIVKPQISLGAGYASLKERDSQVYTSDNVVFHYGGLAISAGAGVSFFVYKSVSLDLGFHYSRNKLNVKKNSGRSQIMSAYVAMTGISFYF